MDNVVLTLLIMLATIASAVAAIAIMANHRLRDELKGMTSRLKRLDEENVMMQDKILRSNETGGVSQATVLTLAGEIARIDNNLLHMDEVPGRKQIMKANERMKGALQAEEYTIVPLLGCPYIDGMNANAVFVPDESLEEGASVIQSVQRPQVNYRGMMIQAASITVGQNVQ